MSVRRYEKSDSAGALLPRIYVRFLEEYGPQGWWPAATPLGVVLGAILTQSVAWRGVERALNNLESAGCMTVEALRDIPEADLADLVRPSGYFNAKAKKIKAFIHHLVDHYDGNLDAMLSRCTEELRPELLSIHGVGEETADDIILYAAGQPSFVIDSYTRRIMKRLGLEPSNEKYSSYQAIFHGNLPSDAEMFNEYHALLDQHAKAVCRKEPQCASCCLRDLCPTGAERTAR